MGLSIERGFSPKPQAEEPSLAANAAEEEFFARGDQANDAAKQELTWDKVNQQVNELNTADDKARQAFEANLKAQQAAQSNAAEQPSEDIAA